MKSKYTFLFFVFLVSFSMLSQPGYMGKKFQAGYGLHFSPAIAGSNGSGNSINGRDGSNAETGELAFNSLHEGFAEYCIKNRTMLGFSVKYYKTTYDNRAEVSANYVDPVYGSSYFNAIPKGWYTIKGLNYAMYFKFYHRKYLAPWGKYFMLGATYGTAKCFYDPSKMYVQHQDNYGSMYRVNYFGPQEQEVERFDILVGFGRNRIIADKITLDYGVNFNAFALLLAGIVDIGEDGSVSSSTNTTYIQNTVRSRLREVNRFNFFVKVGVLLF